MDANAFLGWIIKIYDLINKLDKKKFKNQKYAFLEFPNL